ncbi:MAG: TetR/AcrR family transcriptional regulator [Spirochaetaceae bacterium]|jgi:AcrR family transcriptional regulator|nr:TetR/AcrR family transcriptional regulator [Spirochaetaceae bacterium]
MTRDNVIDAAFRVWGQEFYKTTSLTTLAGTLQVSKPALYRHFPSKQALLQAMEERFYDDYAAAFTPALREILENRNWQERLLAIVRFIAGYFAHHLNYLIYFLIQFHSSNKEPRFRIAQAMAKRGLHFTEPAFRSPTDRQYPPALVLAGITAIYEVAEFHRRRYGLNGTEKGCSAVQPPKEEPSEEEIRSFAESVANKVRSGLLFDPARINAISLEKLEALHPASHTPPNPLLKAVAEVVAEEGLWKASMETVAKRSGLSKSGLYAHFKSKKDMLSRFFMAEFEHIAECTTTRIAMSGLREERLYLAILSIAEYLKARPELLVAMDWVRIQRLELNISLPPALYDFFNDLKPERSSGDIWENIPLWIPFLLAILLIRLKKLPELDYKSLRKMYKFICLGIKGLDNN